MYIVRHDDRKGWRIVWRLDAETELDICGAVNEMTARETVMCLNMFRNT